MTRGRQRRPRRRVPRGESRVGQRFEALVGPVAHGGHCIVRLPEPESRVVFTRHAVPGERVVLEITEGTDGDRFWRGDAVEVLEASPDRVDAPCPVAGPGLCGGCDFQHVAVPAQRSLKAAVVREQLVRLAHLDPDHPLVADLVVEQVPGDVDGLRWRTRTRFVRTPDGRQGLRKHRSHDVVPVEDCLITLRHRSSDDVPVPATRTVVAAGTSHDFGIADDGFWQVHPGAPTALVETVLELLDPQPGESVLDLYAGVGLFARFLGDRVGEDARIVAVEGDREATRHARLNLAGFGRARAQAGSVDQVLETSFDEPFDLVVLDPPREGARAGVVAQVVDRAPRAVAYVACDPAALARDVASFAGHGYRLEALRAFDLFPMTHHVECVALFTRTGPDLR
ncbi:class I SAM-dependent RNA methyltransferase [uncultured Nocardioides sp.]|uniref:RNA methyltransferase, TrmA family n=1 Tax=uncultured Nocardioides sp. TaxID=198441 RepID=A0A6J4PC46_9ACTN|nr:methyltransferase [uncultured Nocardioides sp.]CAA9411833.1 MAG: RNA methyltransferase, TrmA family [uncultured Nocardioides sp.]